MTNEEVEIIKNIIDNDKNLTSHDLIRLKSYIDYKIKNLSGLETKSEYNISFLKDYLDEIGLPVNKLAEYTGISRAHMFRLMSGKFLANYKQLEKIFAYFKVESFEQLYSLAINGTTDSEIKARDINFTVEEVKEFLQNHKITNNVFAEYLGIDHAKLYRVYNGETKFDLRTTNRIVKLLNSEELVDQLSKGKRNVKGFDISFLKSYIIENHIKQTELAEYLGISRQYMSLLLLGQQHLSQSHIDKIFEFFNVESFDELENLTNSQFQFKKTME